MFRNIKRIVELVALLSSLIVAVDQLKKAVRSFRNKDGSNGNNTVAT